MSTFTGTSVPLNVFITGASRGLGLGMVKHYLKFTNERVVASCRNTAQAPDLTGLAALYGKERLLVVPLDVTCAESHANAKLLMGAEGIKKIDILIANAGISSKKHPVDPFMEADVEDMMDVYRTNVGGTVLSLQAHSEQLLTDGPDIKTNVKVCVLMSSSMASIARNQAQKFGGSTAYRASKAGLNMLASTYACDPAVINSGCHVICMHPGWVMTDMGSAGNRVAPVTIEQSAKGMIDVIYTVTKVQRERAEETRKETKASIVEASPLLEELKSSNCVFCDYQGNLIPW
jgi:NAD(P)-dependent dehydrogenase (short-subunit alcohol dehydrogenase family)